MNDKELDDALRACFQTQYTMNGALKAQLRHKMNQKKERRDNLLLCLIQIATFILTLLLAVLAFIADQETIMILFLLAYVLAGNGISVVAVLLYKKYENNKEGQML